MSGASWASPGDEDPLSLPAGELADLPLRERGHPDAVDRAADQFAVRGGEPPDPPGVPVAPHLDHLLDRDRKVPVHRVALRNVGDPVERLRGRLAADQHVAGVDRLEADHRLEERGLAGAVRPDDGGEGPLGKRGVDVPERRTGRV